GGRASARRGQASASANSPLRRSRLVACRGATAPARLRRPARRRPGGRVRVVADRRGGHRPLGPPERRALYRPERRAAADGFLLLPAPRPGLARLLLAVAARLLLRPLGRGLSRSGRAAR